MLKIFKQESAEDLIAAVGAGHLVGPKSVQELLKERGIKAERY